MEPNDIILSKAASSDGTSEVMIFIHSDDEESIDGDQERIRRDHSEEEEDEEEEEEEEEEGIDGGVAKKSHVPPSDSVCTIFISFSSFLFPFFGLFFFLANFRSYLYQEPRYW